MALECQSASSITVSGSPRKSSPVCSRSSSAASRSGGEAFLGRASGSPWSVTSLRLTAAALRWRASKGKAARSVSCCPVRDKMPRILIVEDEPDVSFGLTEDLTRHGYETEVAGDGELALKLGSTGKFDLILLDVMMPVL